MKILFVCTGNTCRSPMACALMKHLGEQKNLSLSCDSAGIYANEGTPISSEAKKVLEDSFGIFGWDHRSQQVTKEQIDESDLVLAVTREHRDLLIRRFGGEEKILAFSEDVGDPFGGDLSRYQKSAEKILENLNRLVESGVIHD